MLSNLCLLFQDIALSSGSACTSASLEPSYVLRAIGADEDIAHSSIRFGIGRFTTEAEVNLISLMPNSIKTISKPLGNVTRNIIALFILCAFQYTIKKLL